MTDMNTPHTPEPESDKEEDNHHTDEQEEEQEETLFEIYSDKEDDEGSPTQRRLSQCSTVSDKENALPPRTQSPVRQSTTNTTPEPKTPGFRDLRLLNESGPVLEDPDSPTPRTKRTHSQSIGHSSPSIGHESEEQEEEEEEEEEADTDYEDVTPRKKIREIREKTTPSPSRRRRRRPPHSPSPL
ncbi:hypothetical protein TRVA0_055S00628 [Trichomonascus vanleenenianus]|uniref:uncharacterized protein n=1 Tax=Trichomonascus vanleenenianus TaxID=2268995 RepID=UPI003ECB1249